MGFFDTGGAGNNFLASRGLVGGLFDNSEQQGMDALRQNRDIYGNLKTPNFQWTDYKPESVDPQMAQATTVKDDPMVKSAQMAALAKMGDLSNTGLSDVDQAGYTQARDLGNQMANSGSQAAMNNAQARGIGGSGMEFANREIANQQGAQRSQQAGLQQAADSARQRALYNQAYTTGLGNMQQQNTNLSAQNAGILNQFNQANTNAANQAQYTNVGNRNQAQQYNNNGRLGLQQQDFNNQVTKAGGEAGANTGIAKGFAAVNDANTKNRNQDTQNFTSMMGMMA